MAELNKECVSWARKLILDGQVDRTGLMDLSATEKVNLRNTAGSWEDASKWFLGIRDDYAKDSHSRYVCQIGRFGRVHLSALKHISLDDAIASEEMREQARELVKLIEDTKLKVSMNSKHEILVYGVLGYNNEAKDIISKLNEAAKNVDRPIIRINSPGGDASEGMALYNYIRSFEKPVDMIVDGIAASALSLVASAGRVKMFGGSLLMLHNPIGGTIGDHRAHDKGSEVLMKVRDSAANAYATKSGKSLDEVRQWMDDTTWFTAQEAYSVGLCDEVVNPQLQMNATYINMCDINRTFIDKSYSPTILKGGSTMKDGMKQVLTELNLKVNDEAVDKIVAAVKNEHDEENATLKSKLVALSKTSMITKLTARIGEEPAKLLGKIHENMPAESFESIISLIANLQQTINDLGGPQGKQEKIIMTTTDEVIDNKVKVIMEAEKVSASEALEILANREPNLVANWK